MQRRFSKIKFPLSAETETIAKLFYGKDDAVSEDERFFLLLSVVDIIVICPLT